ncbi:sugar dehydrogenase complex small subunit [Candidatus Pantoea multigeneris]|uniref:Sorbitol dehydrogenase n=1 Tax=Candidatus Pantoea multigeneris TaxID=2608357 RepID=A0ABX0R993_9GAMM|nr:sugar dehydrogenase complex small subunit [Pantoea multigeneris]NIF20024.1 sorbitol dehydrogenase [Pantoea multigeneris]
MATHNQLSLSRRRLLQGMGILSLGALCDSLFPQRRAMAAELEESGFITVSSLLVSQPVSPLLAQRYYDALQRHNNQFSTQLAALQNYLKQHAFAHVDDFIAATDKASPQFQTASTIIAAWYTGLVGDGAKMELIAYAEALMYRPTRGILVIPTYGGGPLFWLNNPATHNQTTLSSGAQA